MLYLETLANIRMNVYCALGNSFGTDGIRCAHSYFLDIDFDCLMGYSFSVNNICGEMIMSKLTGSQMEAVLLDRIEKAQNKLLKLQQKHKLEIGSLAYKHGLHKFDIKQLDNAFAKLALEFDDEYQ